NSPKSSEQVVLHARTGEDVRPKNVCAAATQRGSTLLNHLIGLTLVNCVGKCMCFENEFLRDRAWQVRAICRDAAGENELTNAAVLIAVGLGDGFHDASRPRNIDLPHAIQVEYAGSHRIDHKGEVHYRDRASFFEQVIKRLGGTLRAKIRANETQ